MSPAPLSQRSPASRGCSLCWDHVVVTFARAEATLGSVGQEAEVLGAGCPLVPCGNTCDLPPHLTKMMTAYGLLWSQVHRHPADQYGPDTSGGSGAGMGTLSQSHKTPAKPPSPAAASKERLGSEEPA